MRSSLESFPNLPFFLPPPYNRTLDGKVILIFFTMPFVVNEHRDNDEFNSQFMGWNGNYIGIHKMESMSFENNAGIYCFKI